MNVKRIRLALRSLTAGLMLATLIVVGWGWFSRSGERVAAAGPRPIRGANRLQGVAPLAEFQPLWDKRLRGAAGESGEDVEQAAAADSQAAARAFEITLLGTILEAGKSKAILIGPDGKIDLKGVGESLEIVPAGAEVKEIRFASVTLSYRGKTITLELEPGEVP